MPKFIPNKILSKITFMVLFCFIKHANIYNETIKHKLTTVIGNAFIHHNI